MGPLHTLVSTPLLTSKYSFTLLPNLTHAPLPLYKLLILLIKNPSTPHLCSTLHSVSLQTLSYTFSRFMNETYSSTNQCSFIYFSWYTQYTYSFIICIVSSVPFPFVYRAICCLQVLWYNTLLHTSIEYPKQPVNCANTSTFRHSYKNTIHTSCFTTYYHL